MTTVSRYRADLAELERLALNDLATLVRDVSSGRVASALLVDILPELVAVYGSAAATLAADWYDEHREAQRIPGRFRALAAELPDEGRTNSLAGWAARAFDDDPATGTMRASGGLQRIIADAGRNTIMRSSLEDPRAVGWQRIGSGECGFCAMLIDRGAVYSEAGADFGAHDHCNCSAAPAFGGRARPARDYVQTSRDITDADRARTREWMREHGYTDD